MPTFSVTAIAYVTLYADIEADTEEAALYIAANLSTPSPTGNAYFKSDEAWRVDAELSDVDAKSVKIDKDAR